MPVLEGGLVTGLTAEEVQQLVVTLPTFQQTPQATVRCVGRYRDIRRELWMPSTLMRMHMEKLVGIYKPDITTSRSLDGVYVDGISITCGNPRKHVWTYAVGLSDDNNYPYCNCPCAKTPGPDPPPFVGSHYHCEAGDTGTYVHATLYSSDPLWDGAGCLSENSCCYDAGLPWFFRQFPVTTTGDIEVRICRDQGFADEGVAVEQLQLYVQ